MNFPPLPPRTSPRCSPRCASTASISCSPTSTWPKVDETVRDAILGNAGTVIAFRTGLNDALILEKEFHPEFTAHDLVNLPNYHVYLKLMIDGVVSKPFSAATFPQVASQTEMRISGREK
jgi:hypothetical protein